jgi:hypothetical protein
MGRPRLHPIRKILIGIVVVGALTMAVAGSAAAAGPWQKSWGDYDNHIQWHDAGWWLKNQPQWVAVNHPEWTENYSATRGQIGDYDRFHAWHYGDGSFDRLSTKVTAGRETPHESVEPQAVSAKSDTSSKGSYNSEGTL